MKKLLSLLLAFSLVMFVACDDDDDSDGGTTASDCSGTVIDIINCADDLSHMAALIEYIDENSGLDSLATVLASESTEYTAFLPDNTAIEDGVYQPFGVNPNDGTIQDLLDAFPTVFGSDAAAAQNLWGVVANHVGVGSGTLTADMETGDTFFTVLYGADSTTYANAYLTIDASAGIFVETTASALGDAGEVTEADIEADNGVVHVVDSILLSSELEAALAPLVTKP